MEQIKSAIGCFIFLIICAIPVAVVFQCLLTFGPIVIWIGIMGLPISIIIIRDMLIISDNNTKDNLHSIQLFEKFADPRPLFNNLLNKLFK